MVNFGPLAAEISSVLWGIPANFSWFRVLAALLHGTLVVGVSQTLPRRTEGATYTRQYGNHVGHWPTFLVVTVTMLWLSSKVSLQMEVSLLKSNWLAYIIVICFNTESLLLTV